MLVKSPLPLSPKTVDTATLSFPDLYLIVSRPFPTIFRLEDAPRGIFDAWLMGIVRAETAKIDATTIDTVSCAVVQSEINRRWQMINTLAERKVDFSRYFYDSLDMAEKALQAMRKEASRGRC